MLTTSPIALVVGLKNWKVCNVSAGVSSFIAGWLVRDSIDEWIYIFMPDQHEDSCRFIKDCENLVGKKFTRLESKEYRCTEDCYNEFHGFGTRTFSPCTAWLKGAVRVAWELEHPEYNITYVWGFDANETKRAANLEDRMWQYNHEFPLIDFNLTKEEAHGLADRLGIKRPIVYNMGLPNNNCIPCIRGGMGYWNKIRLLFPEKFKHFSELERKYGHSILKECYLDELDPERGNIKTEVMEECEIMCQLAFYNSNSDI